MSRSGEYVLRSLSEDFLGEWEKSPNEEWSVDIPSSIDVQPMEETGMNAYAQMGPCFAPSKIQSSQTRRTRCMRMLMIH